MDTRRVAVVTGATGGIGAQLIEKLAKNEINLVIVGRDTRKLDEIQSNFQSLTDIYTIKGDVAKIEDLERIEKETIAKYSKIDILINGAGVTSQYNFWEQPIEEIEKVMWTNYFSYVALTRLFCTHMKKAGSGHIINITSGSVMVDPPPRTFIVYTSLKVGLRSFSKGLFWEMRDFGIKVTSIFPGVTKTPLTDSLKNITKIDTDRLMDPAVVADTVVFALNQPKNVCSLELAVGNQQTPWVEPIIHVNQQHPKS